MLAVLLRTFASGRLRANMTLGRRVKVATFAGRKFNFPGL
jgi:hypothetical protein